MPKIFADCVSENRIYSDFENAIPQVHRYCVQIGAGLIVRIC